MRKFVIIFSAITILIAVPVIISAAGQGGAGPKVAVQDGSSATTSMPEEVDFGRAKSVFQKTCSKCHKLKRPLGKKKNRAKWEKTIEKMNKKHKKKFGKGISPLDTEEIVNYLTAKNTFEATCSKCHALSRPLGKTKDRAAWEKTVKRESENHKAKFGKIIPDDVQANIVGYLVENAGK